MRPLRHRLLHRPPCATTLFRVNAILDSAARSFKRVSIGGREKRRGGRRNRSNRGAITTTARSYFDDFAGLIGRSCEGRGDGRFVNAVESAESFN